MQFKELSPLFVSVTEKAAAACFSFIGKEDKMGADKAATESMRTTLNALPISARVVIGEGERDTEYEGSHRDT